ncbi:DUF1871 family protein [Peribacillus sp. SCS-155]|uniref:DUF1871 family protein n=1 Tax=Peribacillus sedimenti TaxID=3115297 RepID=UPI00390689BF
MERQEMNLQLVAVLQEWDPFGWGRDAYETEIVDCIIALDEIDDPDNLARKIQGIYEFSFEEIIDISRCRQIAEKLLLIKNNASCSF